MSRKIFVSHSHKDKEYADVFVNLLKTFGFREQDIFYSSNASTGVEPGEEILNRLKKELLERPIMIYILSEDYYKSVICLNEMGASWVMTDEHYPVALPGFTPENIKGAVGSNRSTLLINQNFDEMALFHYIEKIYIKANINLPDYVRPKQIDFIKPAVAEIKKIALFKKYIQPSEDGVFEVYLTGKREVLGKNKDKAYCYQLSELLSPDQLSLNGFSDEDTHFLYVWNNQGEFEEGDTVRFSLTKNEEKAHRKFFKDVGNCVNIYVSTIAKVKEL